MNASIAVLLPWMVGSAGLLAIVIAALAILLSGRSLRPQFWRCMRCYGTWLGTDKTCVKCLGPGARFVREGWRRRLAEATPFLRTWPSSAAHRLDTGPIPVVNR